MPAPAPPNSLDKSPGHHLPDEWPVINVELPDLLSDIPKCSEQGGCLPAVVDSSQRTEGPIRVHADPIFPRHPPPLRQCAAVALQLPAGKAGYCADQGRHELRQQAPPKEPAQTHDLHVVVDRALVVQHDGERATRAKNAMYLGDNPSGNRRMVDDTEAVHMI